MNTLDLREYVAEDGGVPFFDWLTAIKDGAARARIRIRLERVRLGNLGDHKALGDGVHELRFTFGPGYRVYFGREGERVILLLGRRRQVLASTGYRPGETVVARLRETLRWLEAVITRKVCSPPYRIPVRRRST